MRYFRRKSKGFTFIEMLIVTVMMSIISLAIYNTLNNGLKIWQRTNKQFLEQDLFILLDKFSVDATNAFAFGNIGFIGAEDKLEFATVVNSQRFKARGVGKVFYLYNRESQTLSRQEQDFSQVYSSQENENPETVKNIKSLQFQYYFYDPQRQNYVWDYSWTGANLPIAIRIEFEFGEDENTRKFVKTVSIPVGG